VWLLWWDSGRSHQMLEMRPSGSPQGSPFVYGEMTIVFRSMFIIPAALSVILSIAISTAPAAHAQVAPPNEGDFVIRDFHFLSGETTPELRIHYRTLGKATLDSSGRTTNAVLLLHGTGASGKQFVERAFGDVLFGPGQLLDANRYFVILPDGIGHGGSSKPSDGMRAHFPKFDYADMVAAQYQLVTNGLNLNHLRLVLGTSMGCMHTWMWAENYPDFMDALMPIACLPVPIAGRNHVFRQMITDAIRRDPDWKDGDYIGEPSVALQAVRSIELIAGSSPLDLQRKLPTPGAAEKGLEEFEESVMGGSDANDLLFQWSASRDYDPSALLGKITARVTAINSADDFINPPELGIAETEITKVHNGTFVLLPISDQTHGHITYNYAAAWQQYLEALLKSSQR
jgi:homoserine O-acetyltransferase